MVYGQDLQCGTVCDGTACNLAQPAMAESAMWVRPEGTWPAPRAQKMLGLLASCRWPLRLDHWRSLPVQLIADMNDLFLYVAGAELQQQSCSSRAAAGSYAGMLRWVRPEGSAQERKKGQPRKRRVRPGKNEGSAQERMKGPPRKERRVRPGKKEGSALRGPPRREQRVRPGKNEGSALRGPPRKE